MKKQSKAEQELMDFEEVFWALSHASRRHVLVVLNSRGGKMPAGDIANRFSCSWPTTTRHLKVLEQAGLVRVTREGREQIYEINKTRLEVANKWLSWFTGGK
jgi:DNA-binding transcriptional ArsR family regulator